MRAEDPVPERQKNVVLRVGIEVMLLMAALEVSKHGVLRKEPTLVAMHLEVHQPPDATVDNTKSSGDMDRDRVDVPDEGSKGQPDAGGGNHDVGQRVIRLVNGMPIAALVMQPHVVLAQPSQELAFQPAGDLHAMHEIAMRSVLVKRVKQIHEHQADCNMQSQHVYPFLVRKKTITSITQAEVRGSEPRPPLAYESVKAPVLAAFPSDAAQNFLDREGEGNELS